MLEAIELSKTQPLDRLITALGIRGVGEVVSRTLNDHFVDLHELGQATLEDLENIPGIGPNIAQAIIDWFARYSNQRVLVKLKESGVWPSSDKIGSQISGNLPLTGLVFVVTGKLKEYSRRNIKQIIQEAGGRITSSVSSKTDFVLVGQDPGSKRDQAQELGIKIISELEFKEMINDLS